MKAGGGARSRGTFFMITFHRALFVWLSLLFIGGVHAGAGSAGERQKKSQEPKYHTPLAGEPFHGSFLGRSIDIPGRDRGNQNALNLGGLLYDPQSGDTRGFPLFALYVKRMRGDNRLRLVASGPVNEIDVARRIAGPLEIVGRFENTTLPLAEKGVENNRDVDASAMQWGTLSAYFGPGLRFPVPPYQPDNDLRLQLLGRFGYLYSKNTSQTGPDVRLPPDTQLYGWKLRGRYDGMRRNILDLVHRGAAAGFDLDFVHRDRWSDFGNSAVTFRKEDTQDYYKFSAYAMAACGVPGLSEKNSILAAVHAGFAERKRSDRFNAYRVSHVLFASETDDLHRPDYPGALFTRTLASRYLLVNLEYRREILFFLYLTLRGAFSWADRADVVAGDQIGFKSVSGQGGSIALTTGFFWKSRLHLELARDSGFLRDGPAGNSLLVFWTKSF